MLRTPVLIGLLGTSLAFLAAAALASYFQQWSFLGNLTVPWFCSAVGIGVLLVTLTSLITDCVPGSIPRARVLLVLIGSSLVTGLGMLVDAVAYELPYDWTASIGEWVGFTLILVVLFWLPRSKGPAADV